MLAAKKQELSLSQELKNTLCQSVETTLQTVFGMKAQLKQVSEPNKDLAQREISGVIAFIQDSVEGTLAFSCSKETAVNMMANVYGEHIHSLGEEVIEGMAEVTNMIHGLVKEHLNKQGFKFHMCLPVVVVGRQHYVFSTVTGHRLVAEFHTLFGTIFAEVVVYSQ